MVTNYEDIKQFLNSKGFMQESETDTELIVLLTRYFKELESLSTEEALKKAFGMLEGSNAIVMIDAENPQKMHCVKSAGPLHIGILKEGKGYIVASEVAVFQNFTRSYIDVKEN